MGAAALKIPKADWIAVSIKVVMAMTVHFELQLLVQLWFLDLHSSEKIQERERERGERGKKGEGEGGGLAPQLLPASL